MDRPSVDVVIPCYRYGAMLPDAVKSVLDQTGVDVRVLIIDDASPDASAEVARHLARSDRRVTARIHAANRGHIATYNEGLDWCDAKYAVVLSADDMLTPGSLARATALLEAHPEVGFVYGRALSWQDGAAPPTMRTGRVHWRIHSGPDWLRRRFAVGEGSIVTPEVVVRTALQHRIGGYDASLPHAGDIEMWMRFALHADVGFLRGADQAFYRVHATNMSKGYFADHGIADLRQRLAAYLSAVCHSQALPAHARAASGWEALARRALARQALQRAARLYDRGLVDPTNVDELVGFAAEALPGYRHLPEWHTLRLRQRLGARRAALLGPLVVTPGIRYLRRHWQWQRLKLQGV